VGRRSERLVRRQLHDYGRVRLHHGEVHGTDGRLLHLRLDAFHHRTRDAGPVADTEPDDDADAVSNANLDADRDTDPYTDQHTYVDADPDAVTYRHEYADLDADVDPDLYFNPDPDCDLDADLHSDADVDSRRRCHRCRRRR
jgi:hypothetical protein